MQHTIHPSIHPSIHVTIIIQSQSLLSPPKVLVHFDRFIQSLYRANDPRFTVITPHRFSSTLSSPPPPSPSVRKIYLTFSINTENSPLDPPQISRSSASSETKRRLFFVRFLCFSMSRATVMDAFTRVRGSNQSLPAAPPNTQEKPECL